MRYDKKKKVRRRKSLDRRLQSGALTLGGLRERKQALEDKNQMVKKERAEIGRIKEPRKKRIRSTELLSQAAETATTGVSRKEQMRNERNQRIAGTPSSKKLKL